MGPENASNGPPREEPEPTRTLPLEQLLGHAVRALADAGIEQPRREARLLLAHALGLDRDAILRLARDHPIVSGPFLALIARRAGHEPLALITGRRGFWSLDLAVDRSTLIPRPDTESLIESALACRPDRARIRTILDLGCGTGALLLAALREYSDAFGVGIDRAQPACRLARRNAGANDLAARAAFACADWAAPLDAEFDLVLSNPPYIETAAIPGLMPEVARHEPALALDGGPDGLDAYRALIPALARLLAPDGLAILEIGSGQADAVTALATRAGLAAVHRGHDLSGTIRAICLSRGAPTKSVGSRAGVG